MNFVAVDFETAQGKRWSICQVGIVKIVDGEVKEKYNSLVKPPDNYYERGNMQVHKIKPSDTLNSKTFDLIWKEISHFFESGTVVSHNSDFDMDCLKQTLSYYQLPFPEFDIKCTYKMTGKTLDESCQAYDIEFKNNHNAIDDAIACAELYKKISIGYLPNFLKVHKKAAKSRGIPEGHIKLSGELLKKDLSGADPDGMFYDKKVVLTGNFTLIEKDGAAEILKKMGADIDTGITKKTNFIITADKPGPKKLELVEKYNLEGSNIIRIEEAELLTLI